MLRLLSELVSTSWPLVTQAGARQSRREDAGTGEDYATDSTQPWTAWGELLKQHVEGESADPEWVHPPAHEQRRHQEPAATEAVGAGNQAHSEWACQPGPPVCSQEVDRRAAAAQAG